MSPEIENITSPETLGAYLLRFGIPVSNWGQGAAKTVSHLLSEIQNGDCELVEENNGLIRRVHVVNLSVSAQFDGKIHTLIEDRQVFNEGTSQERIRKRRQKSSPARIIFYIFALILVILLILWVKRRAGMF